MNTVQKAAQIAGGNTILAKKIGVPATTVQYWLKTGIVPAEFAVAVSEATGGKVRKSHLRPDIWPPRKRQDAA